MVDNDSAARRQQNRRVEVLVLNEGVTAEGATRLRFAGDKVTYGLAGAGF